MVVHINISYSYENLYGSL